MDLPGSDLNVRQKRFIFLYLHGPNAFDAMQCAWQAGYKETDRAAGCRALRLPKIAKEINRRLVEEQLQLEYKAEHIRNGFALIAFDPRESKAGGPSRGERMEALRELGKLMGLYVEKTIHADVSLEQLLRAAGEREKLMPPAEKPPSLRIIDGDAA